LTDNGNKTVVVVIVAGVIVLTEKITFLQISADENLDIFATDLCKVIVISCRLI